MVTIKLFGSLRLKTGCKGIDADISKVPTVKAACHALADSTGHPVKEFKNCVVMINGRQGGFSSRLSDGDELVFLVPSGGG